MNDRLKQLGAVMGCAWTGVALLATVMTGVAASPTHAQVVGPASPAAAPPPQFRSQTPKPPFPYQSEDVTLDAPAGAHLAGTLTVPPGHGPFPAILLINGSGPNDRDETVQGHKPFLVLADALTRRGLVVLRLDKRGVGASTGGSRDLTTADYAADARTALAWLRHRPEVDPTRVGLLGHSEGAEIAPMLVADDRKIAFVVLLAAPAVPGDQLLLAQNRALLASQGGTAAQLENAARVNREIYDIAKSDLPADQAREQVVSRLTQAGAPDNIASALADQGLSPWARWFLRHDPRPALGQIHCPVLALDGSKDVQVVAAQNLPEIRKALAGNPDATVTELPGLNHLFQTAQTGSPKEYATIDETFAPSALALIVDWVGRTVGTAHQ
jgi:pimeloyl-ACP methyl ester carboxylesterase